MKPLVSIIMSVFNGASFLEDTINSVLTQSYKNIEFIIVDDASTDTTWDILNSIKDSRVQILRNKSNMRLAHNLNLCIDLAKGDFIARMDADDICTYNRIQKQVDYLIANPTVSVLGAQHRGFGKNHQRSHYPLADSDIKAGLLFENMFSHPTIMFRKTALINYRYDETFSASQDYELWSRMKNTLEFANLNDILLYYRIHNGQTIKKNGNVQMMNSVNVRIDLIKEIHELTTYEEDVLRRVMAFPPDIMWKDIQEVANVTNEICKSNKKIAMYQDKSINRARQRFLIQLYEKYASNIGIKYEFICENIPFFMRNPMILLRIIKRVSIINQRKS